MTNFYLDNGDILFHLLTVDLPAVVELKEEAFKDRGQYPEAPRNFEDALDDYKKVLTLIGKIAGEEIAPRAEEVDKTGPVCRDGRVDLAGETREMLKDLKQADLMGFTLPRSFGGLNFPKTIYCAAIEIVSRADASLMTLFGLQEISETIYRFGTPEQREKYLSHFASGEYSGAMALTEPDAGSDLSAARLTAEEIDGRWYLSGVKHFITNGCADIILVMARSEPDIPDARGLSLFIYEKEKHLKIRRIESKVGIHGSPTCELQFDKAPAYLLGQRKRGLIKYTFSLMNGARLAVSAQAVGIMEAAYHEARHYASQRMQFGREIENFPPIYEMLTRMRTIIEASRTLLYETAVMVDKKEGMEELMEKDPSRKKDLRTDLKKMDRYVQLFTPLLKCFVTEWGNRLCYDALQIHGGAGYTTDFPIERITRDMRITSIYEGTTQMQVLAAIGSIMKGTPLEWIEDLLADHDSPAPSDLTERAGEYLEIMKSSIRIVAEKADEEFRDYHARRIVDMTADTILSFLLIKQGEKDGRKKLLARQFMDDGEGRILAAYRKISREEDVVLSDRPSIIG